jgi:hypothetical protein
MNVDSHSSPFVDTCSLVHKGIVRDDVALFVASPISITNVVGSGNPIDGTLRCPLLRDCECHSLAIEANNFYWRL